jgi:hypothetical protein
VHQSGEIVPHRLLFVDRFVQWSSSPRDAFDFKCPFAAVPNTGELKALTHLYFNGTGITGTLDFDHHTVMTSDFCCAFQTSTELNQSGEIEPQQLLFVARFVQWSSSRGDFDFKTSFAAVPNIGELKALTHLYLNGTGITGTLDFDHPPVG